MLEELTNDDLFAALSAKDALLYRQMVLDLLESAQTHPRQFFNFEIQSLT
jgi:hypothetical protein